jgi:hypothetical protein
VLLDDLERDLLSLPVDDVFILRQGIGLSEDSEWVMWGDDRIIWLPPAYRPSGVVVMESTMAIGCSLPHMVLITISPSSFPNGGLLVAEGLRI